MPVFFERGDILECDVEAIVLPHAPNDRMPWCDEDEIDLWDVTLDVFERAHGDDIANKYFIERGNGYDVGEYLAKEGDIPKGFIPEKYPEITVTKFCGLPVNCVFHVCVRPYIEYLMRSDDLEFCANRARYVLERCYRMTLDCAARREIKRIAFPLYAADFPKEIAYSVAHSVPRKWLDEKTEYEKCTEHRAGGALNKLKTIMNKQAAEMEIYIVEPREIDRDRMRARRTDRAAHSPLVSEFQQRLEREISAFKGGSDAFRLDFIRTCFNKYVDSGKGSLNDLAQKAYFSGSGITKLKNGDTKKLRSKQTAVALAVAMELGAYERFAFVNCTNNKYPSDETDLLTEKLIAEGKRDLTELIDAIYDLNPNADETKNK